MAEKVKNQSNLTPETFLEHYRAVHGARVELDKAQGIYRASLKAAKGAGINQSQLIACMQLRKQEADDVAMQFRDLGRYMSWLGTPIGTQSEMFGASDDQRPTSKAAEEHTLWECEQAGHESGRTGGTLEDNPHPTGSERFVRWRDGWSEAQEAIASGRAPEPKKAKGRKAKSGNPEDRPAT